MTRKNAKRERNDRVIVMPSWHDRLGEFELASELPARLRKEIEQFFLSTTFFTEKRPSCCVPGHCRHPDRAIVHSRLLDPRLRPVAMDETLFVGFSAMPRNQVVEQLNGSNRSGGIILQVICKMP